MVFLWFSPWTSHGWWTSPSRVTVGAEQWPKEDGRRPARPSRPPEAPAPWIHEEYGPHHLKIEVYEVYEYGSSSWYYIYTIICIIIYIYVISLVNISGLYISGWWWLEHEWIIFFHSSWECHHPNWRTHSVIFGVISMRSHLCSYFGRTHLGHEYGSNLSPHWCKVVPQLVS